jgi:hypothetical protein
MTDQEARRKFKAPIGAAGEPKFNLVGIVPCAQNKKLFNFPWDDCLLPIGNNYLAIERAVYECAYVGCDSVWVVCYNNTQMLVRERLGDYVVDPKFIANKTKLKRRVSRLSKRIPIQYLPIHPRDKGRRDSLGFSILYGIWFSNEVYFKISKYTKPSAFYISFPYGVTDINFISANRADTKTQVRRLMFSYKGETVLENKYLSFTMFLSDLERIVKNVKKGKKHYYVDENGKIKRHPANEAYEAKDFLLSEVLDGLVTTNSELVEVPWYYPIDTWERYCKFLSEKPFLKKMKYQKYKELQSTLIKD